MRIVLQRVQNARLSITGNLYSEINQGIFALVGISREDTEQEAIWMTRKLLNLRIFDDEQRMMNHSLIDIGAELLFVSQFTLYGDSRKGNRPSYIRAAPPDQALPLYNKMCKRLSDTLGASRFKTGAFGENMQIELLNDGPVTLVLETP